jgi:hypothetical protein
MLLPLRQHIRATKQLLDVPLLVASRAERLGIRAPSAPMDVRRGRPITVYFAVTPAGCAIRKNPQTWMVALAAVHREGEEEAPSSARM